MPARRKYASNAERQAAYRARRMSGGETDPSPSKQSDSLEAHIPPRPGYPRWDAMLSRSRSLTQSVVAEMSSYYGARSEGWQCSERGESLQEKLESIEEIASLLEDLPPTRAES